MEDNERCGTCRFWYPIGGRDGLCRRHAPVPDTKTYGGPIWPGTGMEQWCGDYARGAGLPKWRTGPPDYETGRRGPAKEG